MLLHPFIPVDVQASILGIVKRVQALPKGFVSVPKWKEFVKRCETCENVNELKKLKISRSKWEKNVDVYEKNWRDSHIDVTKRNERIERLAERTELLQRHSKLEKAWKACEQHRLSALKSLENAAFPPDISDRLDKWEAKINEYKRLYHEVTGTHPEEEEEKHKPTPGLPDLTAYLDVFERYALQHPTDADFTYDHTEFLRLYRANDRAFEKHFATLCGTLKLCKECSDVSTKDNYCQAHYLEHVLEPRMKQLNDKHVQYDKDNLQATEILQEYLDLDDDAPFETLVTLCERYEESLKKHEEDDDEEDELSSLSSSSSSLESFLDGPTTPFTYVQPPEVSESSLDEEDDDDDDDEVISGFEVEEEEEDNVEPPSSKKRTRSGSVILVNETCDYLLSRYDEQLPEDAKTCLKLLRDGEGSRRALEDIISNAEMTLFAYDVVSTIVATGQVKHNATFETFEEAQAFVEKHPATEYVCRSVVKRRIK